MADPIPSAPPVAQNPQSNASAKQAEQLAANLAAKHGAGPSSKPPPPPPKPLPGPAKGGRRTVQEEAADYLRKNGLVAVPAQTAPGQTDLAPAQPSYVVTPEFVKDCSSTLLKGIESWRVRQVYITAVTISRDKDLSKQLAEEAGAPPGCIDVMAVSLAELSQKYNLLSTWTPELLFCVAMGSWIVKEASLQKKLNALAAQIEEARKKAGGGELPKS